jgi:hypothetical protein
MMLVDIGLMTVQGILLTVIALTPFIIVYLPGELAICFVVAEFFFSPQTQNTLI